MQKKSLLELLMIAFVCSMTLIISCKKEVINHISYDDIEGIYCTDYNFGSFASVLRKNDESAEFEYTLLMKKYFVMQGDVSVGFNIVNDKIIVPLQIDSILFSHGGEENEGNYFTYSRKGKEYIEDDEITIEFEDGHSISNTLIYTKKSNINIGNYGIGNSTIKFISENDKLIVNLDLKAEDLSSENDIVGSVRIVDFVNCDMNISRQNINESEVGISANINFDKEKLKIRLHVYADSNALEFKKYELELEEI